jgi:glycosyltransferase involved in cell wall biosynthesis
LHLFNKKLDKKLVVIGQGGEIIDGKLVADHAIIDCDFEYLGVVTNPIEKAKLIGEASAVLVNTQYIGPFEGVHIEAALCGTPVITTDWGVFTETVMHGVTGYRTRTLGEAVWAANNLDKLDPQTIHNYAVANFSTTRVAELYQAYFEQLETLNNDGWYSDWDKGISKYERYSKRN